MELWNEIILRSGGDDWVGKKIFCWQADGADSDDVR